MDAAKPELPVKAPRAAADPAPIAMPHLELQLLSLFRDLRSGRHGAS
jgi:hypothetical protein